MANICCSKQLAVHPPTGKGRRFSSLSSKRVNLPLAPVLVCSQGHLTEPCSANLEQIQPSEVALDLEASFLLLLMVNQMQTGMGVIDPIS